ncbi:MAG: PAS domain-containing protein [Chthoniobacterales bacterium]
MSWVTFIWALVFGACVTMALPHLLIGLKARAWENLFFAVTALAVAGIACGELAIMHSSTAKEIGFAQQWAHLPVFFLYVGIIGFINFYFGTGRPWLGLAAAGVRLATLIVNFAVPPNLNFREITGLRHLDFLGETVAMPQGVVSSWTQLGLVSSLLMLVYVIDASLTLWRRGTVDARRRAVVVGGSITLFIIVAAGLSALTHPNVIQLPYMISFPFLGVILAMGFELSYDILRAAQTARDLHASEGALRETETRMSLAANAGRLGLWTWNVARDELWLSDKGRTLFGFGESEALNLERFLQAIHIDDRPRIEKAIRGSTGGDEYEREYRIVTPTGETRWMAGYGSVELDAKGRPAFMRGVTRDITPGKLTEEALRESEARFRTVADVAPVMIWMSGPEKEGVFFNKGWLEFTGRTIDQELGEGWLKGVHPEDLPNCLDVCGTAFRKREPFTVEYRLRRKDGEYRWLLDTGAPRFEADGTFLGYIGSCIDIGERKQAELDYQLQAMELARVGRLALMGELAASLAHEVNNPVGAMVTNASAGQRLIASGKIDLKEIKDLLADIVADGHRAREVIEGIRNMVRKSEASHVVVQVNDVVRDLLQMVRADAMERNVRIANEIDADAGRVKADRVQLLQVLLNLTMNAFEAMSVNRPDARRLVIDGGRNGEGDIVVRVRDSGPGFPGGIAEQLFEPFFSTKAEGTGMGLAIARSIVEAHGGKLSAENCADGGALFLISLPESAEAESRAA